ncbi:843_t:CDS:2 [Funneliformis mosseae]|uniref:843_t:CDS:1 n=1 Tax=Funneliformis mosseae TaxID=27381 RepID=A0A9N8ZEN3_FUNMO|nr:843_t:CDS:2 [Funneliformis mosseae]
MNSGRTLVELWLKMVEWTDAYIDTLIEERRNRNIEYHNLRRNRNSYNAMCEYMAGSRRAQRNRLGAQYFDEFRMHFWERPEDEFDRIRTINTSNRRQNRNMGNITPASSIDEVSSMLNQSHRESPTGQRDRSASPIRELPAEETKLPIEIMRKIQIMRIEIQAITQIMQAGI